MAERRGSVPSDGCSSLADNGLKGIMPSYIAGMSSLTYLCAPLSHCSLAFTALARVRAVAWLCLCVAVWYPLLTGTCGPAATFPPWGALHYAADML